MQRALVAWMIAGSAALLIAADPGWKTKPVPDWTTEDARQVLANSPWSRSVLAHIARRQTEDELREGGQMGQLKGLGYDGINDRPSTRPLPASLPDLLKPDHSEPSVRADGQTVRLMLRWESALPVRVAELKAGEIAPPTLSTDGYILSVYGLPGDYFKGDPKGLGKPLKDLAALKREGKKDVKPSSVEVFQLEKGVVVVYMFPLSTEISKKDGPFLFTANIGRIAISQSFNPEEMEFQGKLEL